MAIRIAHLWAALFMAGCAGAPGGRAVGGPGLGHDLTGFWLSATATGLDTLAGELSADRAVRVALSRGDRIRMLATELEIALADRAARGRIDDPVLGGLLRTTPHGTTMELDVHQDLARLVLRPARVRLGAAEYGAVRQRIAGRALAQATVIRIAYYELLRTHHETGLLRTLAEAAEAAHALAENLHEAGNISELEVATRQDLYESARLDLARNEAAAVAQRESLNALMGVWGNETQWTLPARLPPLPEETFELSGLEAEAVAGRADLHAARLTLEASGRALGIARNERWFGGMQVGMSAEREDGVWAFGPAVGLRLPLFARGEVARRRAEFRHAEHALAVHAIEIRAEVRAARERLLAARERTAHYRDVVLPLKQRVVELVQRQYNFMFSGSFELLAARQAEIAAHREHIGALGDYWIARVELKAAVGGEMDYEKGEN